LTAAVRSSRPVAAEGSDPGRERENNEDRVLCDPERGIYAVIDGVGGESGGEVAAQTALDILRARLSRRTTDLDRLVREAIAQANRQIFERAQADPGLSGMSCVLTVAILDGDHGDRATVGHVGDSRLYRLRPGEIRKVTRDHSPVGAREDAGELSEDEAMHHPRRNEIFRDVGSAPHEPDEEGFIDTQEIPFGPDDALLFCSDGLSDMVPSARMREIVESNAGDPQTAVRRLIEAANEAGGKDNISVVLVEGERYAATAGIAGRKPAAVSGSVPVRQYGSASVRVPAWRRALPWALLLAVLAAGAAVYFVPSLRERLLGGLIGQITGPGETPTPPPELSAVLRVGPGETDFATIGEALAEARPGQTVEVAPGEYREAIELPEGVALVSLQPRAAVLHPPSGSTAPVLTASGVDGRISGFKIAPGKDVPLSVGLRLDGSRVQVSEMEISGAATAGIEIAGPDRSSIETSFLHDNAGPGILVSGGAATQIQKNLISKNGTPKKPKTAKAPGVEVRDDARPLLIDNRFEGNAAAGIWLPAAERGDEIYGWNRFEGTTRAKAVQVAPRQAQPQATPGRGR
jgi:serine/threonine protein phosphatase PrpC